MHIENLQKGRCAIELSASEHCNSCMLENHKHIIIVEETKCSFFSSCLQPTYDFSQIGWMYKKGSSVSIILKTAVLWFWASLFESLLSLLFLRSLLGVLVVIVKISLVVFIVSQFQGENT